MYEDGMLEKFIKAERSGEHAQNKRDAERYRFLRAMNCNNGDPLSVVPTRELCVGVTAFSSDRLDAEIDEYMILAAAAKRQKELDKTMADKNGSEVLDALEELAGVIPIQENLVEWSRRADKAVKVLRKHGR